MSTALIVCIVGGLAYLIRLHWGERQLSPEALHEMGKWAFIIGLAFWLAGK